MVKTGKRKKYKLKCKIYRISLSIKMIFSVGYNVRLCNNCRNYVDRSQFSAPSQNLKNENLAERISLTDSSKTIYITTFLKYDRCPEKIIKINRRRSFQGAR